MVKATGYRLQTTGRSEEEAHGPGRQDHESLGADVKAIACDLSDHLARLRWMI